MGKRGPPRTPTETLQMRGGWRGERRAETEPKPAKVTPKKPRWLKGDASEMWDRLAPKIEAMGILTTIDDNALGRYCQVWMRWRKMERFIAEHGEVYPCKTQGGEIMFRPFPQVAMASDLSNQLRHLEGQFGLTPAARSSIQVIGSGGKKGEASVVGKDRFFKSG